MENRKVITIIISVCLVLISVVGLWKVSDMPAFLDYTSYGEDSDDSNPIALSQIGHRISVEFSAPYDLISGISFKTKLVETENGEPFLVSVTDTETNEVIYSGEVSGERLKENKFRKVTPEQKLKVEKGKTYSFEIEGTSIAEHTETMVRVYGGDIDPWWQIVFILYAVASLMALLRFTWKGRQDKLFQALVVGLVTAALWMFFRNTKDFTDEYDNIQGGVLLLSGKSLYRDYVAQHTPALYYICTVFALLGAKSVAQFRICYNLLLGILWGAAYYRHSDNYGRKWFLALPLAEMMLIPSLVPNYGIMILSDGFQGICVVLLLLEFIGYLKEGGLKWDRVIIASCCIWGSIGAAIASVYQLMFIGAALLGCELRSALIKKDRHGCFLTNMAHLFTAVLIPPFLAILYWNLTGSLKAAKKLILDFNFEVYGKYIAEKTGNDYTGSVFQPVINGYRYFFTNTAHLVKTMVTGKGELETYLQFFVIVTMLLSLAILLYKRQILLSFVLFSTMCMGATRGYDFHALPTWYAAIMIAILAVSWKTEHDSYNQVPKVGVSVTCAVCIVGLVAYTFAAKDGHKKHMKAVSAEEHLTVALTQPGDPVLMDSYSCNTLYVLQQGRKLINTNVYFLPWYMEWYEKQTIQEMKDQQPKVVAYNPDVIVWSKYEHFAPEFESALKENYRLLDDNSNELGYDRVWVRKEQKGK